MGAPPRKGELGGAATESPAITLLSTCLVYFQKFKNVPPGLG